MNDQNVAVFSLWAPGYPSPIAHRLEKIIGCLKDSGKKVILVSFFKGNYNHAALGIKHYSLEKLCPPLKYLSKKNSPNDTFKPQIDGKKSFLKKILPAVFRTVFAPDIAIILAIPASMLLVWALIKFRPRFLMSVTDPASFAFMGSLAGKIFRRNVISDLGDLWYIRKEKHLNFNFERKVHKGLERLTVANSNLVTFAYPELRNIFSGNYPEYSAKMQVVEQGFDGRFISLTQQKEEKNSILRIGYFGTLNMSMQYITFFPFLESLKLLLEEHPKFRNRIRLMLAGRISAEFTEKIKHLGLNDITESPGYLGAGELEKKMAACDGFIVVSGEATIPYSILMPQKLYMYLPYKKPIIYIGNVGVQIERLRQFYSPLYAFYPNEIPGMKIFLKKMANRELGDFYFDEKVLQNLDFRKQFNSVFEPYFHYSTPHKFSQKG